MIPDELLVGVAGSPDEATALPFVEIAETFDEPPAAGEAARWRGRARALLAWQVITHPQSSPTYRTLRTPIPEHAAVGHFARSRWTDEAWTRIDAIARLLGMGTAVVLRTPPSFRPTREHETRIENFIAHAARPGLIIAWEWSATWTPARAIALAERIGVVPVVDPMDQPVPGGDAVYLRVLGGKSGRRSPTDDHLKRIIEQVGGRTGWVVFANAARETDALRLRQML